MNFDVFYNSINFDVPKVLKMSPHIQRLWDKCPLILKSLTEHCNIYYTSTILVEFHNF